MQGSNYYSYLSEENLQDDRIMSSGHCIMVSCPLSINVVAVFQRELLHCKPKSTDEDGTVLELWKPCMDNKVELGFLFLDVPGCSATVVLRWFAVRH
mmetsp:Transcript_4571/g.8257  ORF Transcript_4571/g.8257 Transcript_4571/m.8257 type:complete len:97 (+) Transcript_4571:518-808(+)